jgi:probable HAF family extracellular repeat protein
MGYPRVRRSKAPGAWAITMAAAITATAAAAPLQAGEYVVQAVGNMSTGVAINASGQVAGLGSVQVGQGSAVANFLSGPNGGSPLTNFGFSAGTPLNAPYLGLNDNGLIATTQFVDRFGTQHAFLIGPDPSTRVDLGTLPGGTDSFGSGVNNSGQVVGTSYFSSGEHAFYSDPNGGALHDIGAFAGGNSTGTAISNAGDVVGFSDVAKFQPHAFLFSGGVLHDLGTLGGSTSEAYAVNSSGQVAGTADLASGTSHAFVSDANGGALHDLGALSGGTSSALGINSFGQVVGDATIASSGEGQVFHAFVYTNGQLLDLNSLISPSLGITLTSASGINDLGQIVASGYSDSDFSAHAYLLTPASVPEPASFVLLFAGMAGVVLVHQRRRR